MRPSTRIGIVAALALVSGTSAAFGAVEVLSYNLQLLDVPGTTNDAFSTARAINAQGRIVGWFPAGPTEASNPAAFTATPNGTGGYTVARFPTPATGLAWVQPYDLNDDGVIVGQSRTNTSTTRFAFGNSNPAARLLGPPASDESEATGISNSGQVVGWRTLTPRIEAFYLAPGAPQARPLFPSGLVRESRALGINDQGKIVGYSIQNGSTDSRGFIYDVNSGGAVTDLGSITVGNPSETPPLWRSSYDALSINQGGQVAATQLAGTALNHAVLFSGARVIDLGVVGTFEESFAAGISDTGWVVGFLKDAEAPSGNSGFLWANGQMFDLSALALPAGWTGITAVYDAYSQVASGNQQIGTIVGEGTYLGTTRAFAMQITLQVPEPHTYLMLGVGLLAIGALRARRLGPH